MRATHYHWNSTRCPSCVQTPPAVAERRRRPPCHCHCHLPLRVSSKHLAVSTLRTAYAIEGSTLGGTLEVGDAGPVTVEDNGVVRSCRRSCRGPRRQDRRTGGATRSEGRICLLEVSATCKTTPCGHVRNTWCRVLQCVVRNFELNDRIYECRCVCMYRPRPKDYIM